MSNSSGESIASNPWSPPKARTLRGDARSIVAIAALLVLLGIFVRVASPSALFAPNHSIANTTQGDDTARYVAEHPFDFVGFAALAETALVQSNARSDAERALAVARELAPVDPLVTRSEFRVANALGDKMLAMRKAARLLDMSSLDQSEAMQTLAAMADDPLWPSFIAEQIKGGWRGADALLLHMCEQNVDNNRLLLLAHQVARTRALTSRALHCVEHKLVQAGAVDTAYHLRLVGTPNLAKQLDYVFNGDFEQPVSGSAFDWNIAQGGAYRAGFEISLRRSSDNGRTGGKLVARFSGRAVQSPLAQQYLALIPGRYRIVSSSVESGFDPGEAPSWTLRCVEPKAQSPTLDWREEFADERTLKRSATFAIGRECAGQVLSFAVASRLKSLEGVRGTVAVDSVRIERI